MLTSFGVWEARKNCVKGFYGGENWTKLGQSLGFFPFFFSFNWSLRVRLDIQMSKSRFKVEHLE